MSDSSDYITLCSSGNWNFFIKKDEYKFVYLSFYLGHNDIPQGTNITYESPVEIRIPIDIWRKMITEWQSCSWGKSKKFDNMSNFGAKLIDDYIKSSRKLEK